MEMKKGMAIFTAFALLACSGMVSAAAPEQDQNYRIVKGSVEESKGTFVFESSNVFDAFVADQEYSWVENGITYSLKEGDVIGSYQGDAYAEASSPAAVQAETENRTWEENGQVYRTQAGDVFGSYQGDQLSGNSVQAQANNEVWATHRGARQPNSSYTQERVSATTQAYIRYTANNCVHNVPIDSYSRAQYVFIWVRHDSGRQWNRNAGVSVAYTDWIDYSAAQQFEAKTFWGTEE